MKSKLQADSVFQDSDFLSIAGSFWASSQNPSRNLFATLAKIWASYGNFLLEYFDICRKLINYQQCPDSVVFSRFLLYLTKPVFDQDKLKWRYDLNPAILSASQLSSGSRHDGYILEKDAFVIEPPYLYLPINVFDEDSFVKSAISESVVAYVWAKDLEVKVDLFSTVFNSVLVKQGLPTTEAVVGKAFLNLLRGRNIRQSLLAVVCRAYGIPVSEYDEDEVVKIYHAADKSQFIVETKNTSYIVSDEFDIFLNVGDTLNWGDPIVGNCFIDDFHDRIIDPRIEAIRLDRRVLRWSNPTQLLLLENDRPLFYEDGQLGLLEATDWLEVPATWNDVLWLPNSLQPVRIVDGQVRLTIDGDPDDVEQFWQLVANEETRLGYTLADKLIALYGAIPDQLNTAQFFTDQLLHGFSFIVAIPEPAQLTSPELLDSLSRLCPSVLWLVGKSPVVPGYYYGYY